MVNKSFARVRAEQRARANVYRASEQGFGSSIDVLRIELGESSLPLRDAVDVPGSRPWCEAGGDTNQLILYKERG